MRTEDSQFLELNLLKITFNIKVLNSVAMPSIIVWGLGIPFFAFILMYRERAKLDKVETKEKFGFLYNGYQVELFFWEIVIMYRKIAMIFIAVFI